MLASEGYIFAVYKARAGRITSVWIQGPELPGEGISGTSVCHPHDMPVKEYGRFMAVLKAVKPLPARLRKVIVKAYEHTGARLPDWEKVYRLNGKGPASIGDIVGA